MDLNEESLEALLLECEKIANTPPPYIEKTKHLIVHPDMEVYVIGTLYCHDLDKRERLIAEWMDKDDKKNPDTAWYNRKNFWSNHYARISRHRCNVDRVDYCMDKRRILTKNGRKVKR